MYLRYRIGKINDYHNSYSVVDYQSYSDKLEIWDAFKVSSAHRGYALAEDSIAVFLNFKKVGDFKTNEEADALIAKLLSEAPVDLSEYAGVFK